MLNNTTINKMYEMKLAYVIKIRHPEAGELDSSGGKNRQLRRENWTLTNITTA